MKNFIEQSAKWNQPVFKVLAHNDTGAAVGHQGGILIPKALRKFFPTLAGPVSRLQPTIDKRVKAELFVEDDFVGTVNTRYQFQTWTGTRSPESRITDELGPMRNAAHAGDVLLIQRSSELHDLYRFTLVRRASKAFGAVATGIGSRRWGVLSASN